MKDAASMNEARNHLIAALIHIDKAQGVSSEDVIPERKYRRIVAFMRDNNVDLDAVWEFLKAMGEC